MTGSAPPSTNLWPEELKAADGVILGEIHGTNEYPAAFLELVKTGPKPMLVALELNAVDANVPCKGRRVWPHSWDQGTQDGRRSKAMFDMICELQELERIGQVQIIYFDNRGATNLNFYANASRLIGEGMASGDFSKFAVLSGNFHSANAENKLAALLRTKNLSVVTATGSSSAGSAWVCREDGCGPTEFPSPFCKVSDASPDTSPRWLFSGEPGTERIGTKWDACLSVPSTTASPPAADQ